MIPAPSEAALLRLATIARHVMVLLTDPEVRSYLAELERLGYLRRIDLIGPVKGGFRSRRSVVSTCLRAMHGRWTSCGGVPTAPTA